jgi:hypothetical protein
VIAATIPSLDVRDGSTLESDLVDAVDFRFRTVTS